MITDKDQKASVLNDLKMYILVVAIIIFLFIVAMIISLAKKHKEWIEAKLQEVKKKFMWNSLIQSIDIAYIEVLMTAGTQISMVMHLSEWQDPNDLYMAYAMGGVCLALPLFATIFLHLNHDDLMTRGYKDKYEYMYHGVHNHRSKWSKFYWPISLVRKILFVSAPALLYKYPWA